MEEIHLHRKYGIWLNGSSRFSICKTTLLADFHTGSQYWHWTSPCRAEDDDNVPVVTYIMSLPNAHHDVP